MKQDIVDSLNHINKRNAEYNSIIDYFVKAGALRIVPTNNFDTTIAVCGWGNDQTNMSRDEIVAFVHKIVADYPLELTYFTMKPSCNCVEITHNDIF